MPANLHLGDFNNDEKIIRFIEIAGVLYPVHVLVDSAGNDIGVASNPMYQKLASRAALTTQTHNAVNIAAGAWAESAWLDTEGYDEIAATLLNDAATSSQVNLLWSHDGVAQHGEEILLAAGSDIRRAARTGIKAQYMKLTVLNNDAAAHVISTWARLFA